MGQLIKLLKEIEISSTRAFLERDFTKPDYEFFTIQIKDDEYLCDEYKKSGNLEIEILQWKEILKIKKFLDNKKIPHEIHNHEEIIIPNYKRYFAIRGEFKDIDDEDDLDEIEIKPPKRIWDFSKYIHNFNPKNIKTEDIIYNIEGDKVQYKVKDNFPSSQNILCSTKYEWESDFNKIPSTYWSYKYLFLINYRKKPKLQEIEVKPSGQLDLYYKEWYDHYNKFREKVEDSGFITLEDAENVYETMREKIADKLNISLNTNKLSRVDLHDWEWQRILEKIDNVVEERFELKYGISYWDIYRFFWGLKRYVKKTELQEIEIKPKTLIDNFLKQGQDYYIQDEVQGYKIRVKFIGKQGEKGSTRIWYSFRYDVIWTYEKNELEHMIKNKLITKA